MVNCCYNHLNTCDQLLFHFPTASLSTVTPQCATRKFVCLGHLENHLWVISAAMSPGNIHYMKLTSKKTVNPISRQAVQCHVPKCAKDEAEGSIVTAGPKGMREFRVW